MGKASPEPIVTQPTVTQPIVTQPTVTQTDEELLGPNRVVFDNVLTDDQCQVLIDLAKVRSGAVLPVVMLCH